MGRKIWRFGCLLFIAALALALFRQELWALSGPHGNQSCGTCHGANWTDAMWDETPKCLDCHNYNAGALARRKPFSIGDASRRFNFTYSNASTARQTSHAWGVAFEEPRAGATGSRRNYVSRKSERVSCPACHYVHGELQKTDRNPALLRAADDAERYWRNILCFECHAARNVQDHVGGSHPVRVMLPSGEERFNNPPRTDPAYANISTSILKLYSTEFGSQTVLCLTCHGIHAADSNPYTYDILTTPGFAALSAGDGNLLRRYNDSELCRDCHNYQDHRTQTCRNCHRPHNVGGNYYLIMPNISTPVIGGNSFGNVSVVLTAYSSGFAKINDDNAKGPCEACHRLTTDSPSGAMFRGWSSAHAAMGIFKSEVSTYNCLECHKHSTGSGSGSFAGCNNCHGTPPFTNDSGIDGYAVRNGVGYNTSGVFLDESQTPHYRHAVDYPYGSQGGGYGTGGKCRACHANASNMHMNGVYQNVAFGLYSWESGDGRSYDAGTRQCANVYCHSNGGPWNGVISYSPPTWGDDATKNPNPATCDSCHSYPPATNRHLTHAAGNYGLDCANCHDATVDNYSSIADTGYHVNRTKDVIFGERATTGGASPSYDGASHRCSDVYCHGNFVNGNNTTVQWNGASPCGSCHEVPNTTSSHNKHVTIYGFDCADCHEGTMDDTSNSEIAGYATHVDGVKSIEFGLARNDTIDNTAGFWTAGTKICDNIYCHSNALDLASPFSGNTSNPTFPAQWGASGQCNYCHGNQSYGGYTMAMPAYISGSPKANSHPRHVIDNGIGCKSCHNGTTTDNVTISNPVLHANMTYDIGIETAYDAGGASYNGGTKVCSNVRCHGGNDSPAWGTTANCSDCHYGANDVDDFSFGSFSATAAMISQSQWTSTGHGRNNSTTYAGSGRYGAELSCLKCHDGDVSHGDESNPFRLVTSAGNPDTLCLACHGSGTSAEIMNFALQDPPVECMSCHVPPSMDLNIIIGIRSHSFAGISGGGGYRNHTTWRIAPKCVDCHDPHGDSNLSMVHSKAMSGGSDAYGRPDVFFNKSTVVFSRHSGADSYAANSDTSVCQACHTATDHFRQNGLGGASDQDHDNVGGAVGRKCTPVCHNHKGGFAHGVTEGGGGGGTGCVACHGHEAGTLYDPDMSEPYTAGAIASIGAGTTTPHSTHTEVDADDQRGPGIYCNTCHDINNMPTFKSGTDGNGDGRYNLAETDVCNACHSPGGSYDGVNDAVVGAKNNWKTGGVYLNNTTLKSGKGQWCIGCHDETPAMVNGETAPNKVGDNSTYGFYVTGHGKAAGNYGKLSWQDSAATGNPAANRNCTDCHNTAALHIYSGTNPVGSRLKTGFENDQLNSNCANCHRAGGAASAAPFWFTNMTSYEKSAHKTKLCSECHDVHGGTANPAMTKGAQEALCFTCHASHAGHALGVSFGKDGKTYSLECVSCHNVHKIIGMYDGTAYNRSVVTKFTNNTSVWGDDPEEKMDAYAGGGTYRTPKMDSYSGHEMPDYPSFCLDCHATSSAEFGPHGDIDWSGDPHGTQSANEPNGGGTCPDWYACGKSVGWDGDDCTASDPDSCWPVISRGRGDQLWSRGAYNHEERIAGANFTLSCIDCHVTHEAGIGSKLRTTVNGGPGSTTWNTMCNNCHYYYSDWHAGMACGSASCHVENSIHRIAKKTGSGGTRSWNPDLVLDMRFDNNLNDSGNYRLHGKWMDDISGSYMAGKSGQAVVLNGGDNVQVGTRNASWSTDEGQHGTWKYTEMKFNATLEAWVYPTDDAKGEYTIFSKHVGYSQGGYSFSLVDLNGTLRAAFRMQADNNGTAQDGMSGIRGAYSSVAVPLNTWTHVAATFDTGGPDKNPSDPSAGRIRIFVNGVDVTTSDSTGNYIQPAADETSIYAYSENSPWNEGICSNGTWCASEFSVGGFYGWQNSFYGGIDEARVWNVTKDAAYFSAYDAQAAPYISTVEGVIGGSQLTVTFSEGVYTDAGASGGLAPADFVLSDTDDGRTITGVTHTAGGSTAVLTLSSALDGTDDIGVDTLAAAANAIYDEYSLAAGTTAAVISASSACPSGVAIFDLNEPSGSSYVFDGQGLLSGAVYGGVAALTGSAYSGDGAGGRYILFSDNDTCLQASDAMTIEARIKPSGLDAATGSADYIRRIIDRTGGGNYQLSVWRDMGNVNFTGFTPPDGITSIALWVNVVDAHGGAAWKPVLSDYATCPIQNDRWYKVRAVWNVDKPGGTTGQPFVPADIYIDDQGTNGDDAGEAWSGYANCTNSAQTYQANDTRRLYTDDTINVGSGDFAIGTNGSTPGNQQFNGLIDWLTWEEAAQ